MAHSAAASLAMPAAAPAAPGIAALQRLLLWFAGCAGGIVIIEPSPYEIAVLGILFFFGTTGLRLRLAFLPLGLLLLLVNLGYTICAAYLMDQPQILTWILTSWYLGISALLFAAVAADDTVARLKALRNGLIAGAVLASLAGIVGYFHLVPGRPEAFTLYGRAAGTFKDPNVLGAFLIMPALFALQAVLVGGAAQACRNALYLAIIALAVLLSFSRAAWGQLVLTSVLLLALMYLTTPSPSLRRRMVTLTVIGAGLAALALMVLLSFDTIGNLFKERAALEQSYDAGRFGRFGRYLLGAQMALELPFGIGPLQFNKYFPEDTHNSYLNAFMSGGWLSGICYPALIFMSVFQGLRHAFVRVPWQRAYLVVFVAFVGTVGESFIIDTDHWRHFWLMLGLLWGMIVATWQFVAPGAAERPPR
jgi:hypothetical protein